MKKRSTLKLLDRTLALIDKILFRIERIDAQLGDKQEES